MFEQTERNRVRRLPKRGAYDRETVYGILDEAMICHVGFVQDGQPFVIPTLHARQGDNLLLHGSAASRMMRHLAAGEAVCVTATLVDGIVLARSVFNHSMNYRSAVVFGAAVPLEEPAAKLAAMQAFTEKLLPGRWADVRQPNEIEMKATTIVALPLTAASAKVRTGPPGDEEEDYTLPVWAGVLPLTQQAGEPVADPRLAVDIPVPDYVRALLNEENRA